MKTKKIEVCLGVGLNQFFPDYITIEVPQRRKKPLTKVKKSSTDEKAA